MKEAAEAIDRLFSHMGTVLRYFAPGFAALFVVAAVFPDSRTFLLSRSPSPVVLGMLVGSIIYGVHTGALLRLLWLPIGIWLRKFYRTIKPDFACETIFELDEQRWLRRASEDREVQAVQREMDKWAAMLNFLYCVSYTMILIPHANKIYPNWRVSFYSNIIFGAGVVVLLAAFISEGYIIGKEIRLIKQYHNGKNPKSANQTDPE